MGACFAQTVDGSLLTYGHLHQFKFDLGQLLIKATEHAEVHVEQIQGGHVL